MVTKITLDKLNRLQSRINILEKHSVSVFSESGYKQIKAIGVTSPDSNKIMIRTKDFNLSGSPLHRVKYLNQWIFLKDIKIGDYVNTSSGIQEVLEIKNDDNREDLWDIEVDGSEYFSNGILSHNSSLLDSFDYTLYGKVRGRKKRWATLSTLPNRINGELLNRIKFVSNGTEVEVKRGISPNMLELWENGVLNERAGKANIDEKIEGYIGVDIETFKSFISMSIDSFKNFISLSNEEKQLLLDKLFNLEVINILNTILKDIAKNNKVRAASFDAEIRTLDDSIVSIKRSIEKALEREREEQRLQLEREKEDIQAEIDRITAEVNSKKEDYKTLKEKIDKIKEKENELGEELEVEKRQFLNTQNDIKNVQKELDLYDSGKCPTCKTDFNSEHFSNLRTTLEEKKSGFESIKAEIEENIKKVKERQVKLKGLSETTTTSFNDLTYLLRNYKTEIEKLTKKKAEQKVTTNTGPSVNIQEFEKTILELEEKKTTSTENITVCKEKELYYKELNRIFGEDGVKKSIIAGIIKPINHFISENVKKMMLPFEVKLDETFTAEIRQLGSIVEHDSLSTGETKKVNISILIAYLKLIRTKRHINILFLDEVFSSIDIEGIDSILALLKSFANDYNINIFVVHHAILNQEMFDRILKINKEVFSSIEEINYESN
jgi:DNA repair exonuclease SbcCD ATPase subunit